MSEHSLISASASERISACPISVLGGPSPTSEYAAEGTMLHTFGENLLTGKPLPAVGEVFAVEGFTFKVTDEHIELATTYADNIKAQPWEGSPNIEGRVHYGRVLNTPHNMSFGTADCSGILNLPEIGRCLGVDDLKGGRKFVPATALQLYIYAAGVIQSHFDIFPLPMDMPVRLRIHQPRLGKTPQTHFTTVGEVLKRAALFAPSAQAAVRFKLGTATALDMEQFPELAGDHCHYCTRKPVCNAFKQKMRQATQPVASWESVKELWLMSDAISKGIEDIDAWVQGHAEKGTVLPGTKLVKSSAGRPSIVATDAEIDAYAAKYGIADKVKVTKPVYLTPAKMRDAFAPVLKGKPEEKEVMSRIISTPAAKFKLVPADGPGEAVASPQSAFTGVAKPANVVI